jgi:repressor LexA
MGYKIFEELCKKNGVKPFHVSKATGIKTSTLTAWKKGTYTPKADKLQQIADFFGVSFEYLTTGSDPTVYMVKPDVVRVPVLGRVAAGIPLKAITDITDYEEISPAMLKGDSEYYGLEIKGKSMEPRIREGDHIIFRAQNDAETGDIVVVMVNGEDATCKKLRKYDHGIDLISLNPVYEPMYFSNEQIEQLPVTIIGKVVELRAKL